MKCGTSLIKIEIDKGEIILDIYATLEGTREKIVLIVKRKIPLAFIERRIIMLVVFSLAHCVSFGPTPQAQALGSLPVSVSV